MKKTNKTTQSSISKSKKPVAAEPRLERSRPSRSDSPRAPRPPRTMADVPPAMRRELNTGVREARTLVELLVIDFAALMDALGAMPKPAIAMLREAEGPGPDSREQGARVGITQRMELAGSLLDQYARASLPELSRHTSDTVRGWAAYALARREGLTLAQRLSAMHAFADDPNAGVREWAWLAVRPAIVAEPLLAIRELEPWTAHASPNIRRFATESTRPRGVWCAHIDLLKREPHHALALLRPLRADASRYVQNSVANWLNDAAKTQPDFTRDLTRQWLRAAKDDPATAYICRRAMRSLD